MSKVNIQVFTDFDGTLSIEDTGVLLIDDPRSMGVEKRKALEHQILEGKIVYREAIWDMWDSVNMTWEEAWDEYLNECSIDPEFPEFFEYCRKNEYPVTVVSSGLHFLVKKVLVKYLGEKKANKIEIIANNGKLFILMTPLKKHRAAAPEDTIFVFCGDGVSDISAAKHADVLFARNGKDLVTYCERHNIPYIGFDSFEQIHKVVSDLADRKSVLQKDEKTGFSKVVSSV